MIGKRRIESRVLEITQYMIDTKSTVRITAKVFGVSRSTVYNDITKRILGINPMLAKDVEKVLMYNKSQRYLRGVEAKKKKISKI
ncbi:sporulation transcriptional regulator SpoIIID [Clostridium baratii]|uniref:sporulation transcriptional regulator SpoIIID n=1 Tax=Clostridium baratii TaxID=1561 RepID=UPI0036F2B327